MRRCLDETGRRRTLQRDFNTEHGITPRGVVRSVEEVRFTTRVADARTDETERKRVAEPSAQYRGVDLDALVTRLEKEMREAAAELDFETAARLRDELFEVKARRDGASRRRDPFAAIRASG
jgi:excinuclease ABC subunit B